MTTYWVDGKKGKDKNDGLSPETAFKNIPHALNVIQGVQMVYCFNINNKVYLIPTQA